MAGNIGNRHDNDGINEINITPFVDIVLVLLIIFMISTPAMVYRGLKVSLPKAATSEDMSHVTMNISITKDGNIHLDSRKETIEDLKKAFQRLKETQVASDALISADNEVPHGKVMEVADFLRSVGVAQVGFATRSATSGSGTKKKSKSAPQK